MAHNNRDWGIEQDWWTYLGISILVSLGVVILFLGGLVLQFSGIISTTTRAVLVAILLLNLLVWLLVAIYYHLSLAWQKRLAGLLSRLERSSPVDEEAHIARLEERIEHLLHKRFDDLSRTLQENLKVSSPVDVGWPEALYHAFLLISEAENEQRIHESIVTAFSMLTSCREVMLLLGENELGPLKLTAAIGLSPKTFDEWFGREWRPPLWGVVAPALAKRRPYSSPILSEHGKYRNEFPWTIEGEHLLALPLIGTQSVQGVVALTYESERRLDAQPQLRILEIVAQFAGRTLENVNLARTTQEHMAELVTLYSITRSLASASSLDELLALLSAEAEQLLGPASVGLVLGDGADESSLYTSFSPGSLEFTFFVERVDWRVVRWVYGAVQPVFYTPGQVGEDVGSVMFETSGPVMAVPIEGHDVVWGVLVVVSKDDRRAFEEHHLVGMRTIASALAVALAAIRPTPSLVSATSEQLTSGLK